MRQQIYTRIAFGVALVSIAGLLILAGIVLTNPGANSHTPQAIISSIPSPVPPTTTSAVQPIVNTATLVPTPTPLPPSPTATAALTVMTPGVGVGTPIPSVSACDQTILRRTARQPKLSAQAAQSLIESYMPHLIGIGSIYQDKTVTANVVYGVGVYSKGAGDTHENYLWVFTYNNVPYNGAGSPDKPLPTDNHYVLAVDDETGQVYGTLGCGS